MDFVKLFNVKKDYSGQEFPSRLSNAEEFVVISYPKLSFHPTYRALQLQYYVEEPGNDAITRWHAFLRESPPEVRSVVEFQKDLSEQLEEVRINGLLTQDQYLLDEVAYYRAEWMGLSEFLPNVAQTDEDAPQVDDNFDFNKDRANFCEVEISDMVSWLRRVKLHADVDSHTPDVNPHSLNEKQLADFKIVSQHLRDNQPYALRLIINGTAGVGKSHTINALSTLLGDQLLRAAPCTKAAFLIQGVTLHSLLKLPVRSKYLKPLSANMPTELYDKF
ncbi:hypothetical protein MIR68_008071 [Amoeboaphelidium protococcarum]|nr:hypothetical protein MIR68_008071 [Amoeboaphelidium protococcarum]